MTDKPKQNLFKLTNEMAQIKMALDNPDIDDETGEVVQDESLLSRLMSVEGIAGDKVDSYIDLIETCEHDANLAVADYESKRDIIERAKARKKHNESIITKLTTHMLNSMQNAGMDELVGTSGRKIKVQVKSTTVEVAGDTKYSLWDQDYYTTDYKPNKAALKKDFKDREQDLPAGASFKKTYKAVVK